MVFSSGFWDTIFGTKVALQIPDSYGNIVKRSVTKKWLDLVDNEERVSNIDPNLVRVHMLDGKEGYRVIYWIADVDIEKATVAKFSDSGTGDLYAIYYFEQDEPKIEFLDKTIWEMARDKLR